MTAEELIETLGRILSAGITQHVHDALPDLLNKLDVSNEEIARKDQAIETLETRLAEATAKISEAEFAKAKAEREMKEKAWIAHELGKFVSDLANGLYEGQESAAAKRIYDLNGGSLKRKRTNAADYETEEEAREAFEKQCKQENNGLSDYLKWLFSSPRK